LGENLLSLFKIIYRPIPKNGDENEKIQSLHRLFFVEIPLKIG